MSTYTMINMRKEGEGMSETDTIRAMLDERGVEWTANETTLGSGECRDADVGDCFVCSECEALVNLHSIGRSFVDEHGKRWYATSDRHGLNFCPNCGRRIVG